MALNKTQRADFAAHVKANADPVVSSSLASGNHTRLAEYYNGASDKWVWKKWLSVDEYRDAIDWIECSGLTPGDARIWEWVTSNMTMPIQIGSPNVRKALADAWKLGPNTKTNMDGLSKRLATHAELVFAEGTAKGTEADPLDLGFEGDITTSDIGRAINENKGSG